MKNLKKLNKKQLKTIVGADGEINPKEPEFCMYYCSNGEIICAICSKNFNCPDNSM